MKRAMMLFLAAMAVAALVAPQAAVADEAAMAALGEKIFHDTRLSAPPGQSCASCHDAATGFADPDGAVVSPGAISSRFGNRNAPTAAYLDECASLTETTSPITTHLGGFFWDGRADSLEDQALQPFFNPVEMNAPNERYVVMKVATSKYVREFRDVFGPKSISPMKPSVTMGYIAQAIAAYERSAEMNSFTSKYDRFLTATTPMERMGTLSMQQMRGLHWFNTVGKCSTCHTSGTRPKNPDMIPGMGGGMGGDPTANMILEDMTPMLTDFSYHNLGLPANPDNPWYAMSHVFNPDGEDWVDLGLYLTTGRTADLGRFKTPTLRNVALTAPYGHAGQFETLEEIVRFYSTRDVSDEWGTPEMPLNVNDTEMGNLGLTDSQIADIVAFLEALTDEPPPAGGGMP